MTNRDTRYHRLDTVNENAKFLIECYGKETAVKICNDNIMHEIDNPISNEYWQKVLEVLTNG